MHTTFKIHKHLHLQNTIKYSWMVHTVCMYSTINLYYYIMVLNNFMCNLNIINFVVWCNNSFKSLVLISLSKYLSIFGLHQSSKTDSWCVFILHLVHVVFILYQSCARSFIEFVKDTCLSFKNIKICTGMVSSETLKTNRLQKHYFFVFSLSFEQLLTPGPYSLLSKILFKPFHIFNSI